MGSGHTESPLWGVRGGNVGRVALPSFRPCLAQPACPSNAHARPASHCHSPPKSALLVRRPGLSARPASLPVWQRSSMEKSYSHAQWPFPGRRLAPVFRPVWGTAWEKGQVFPSLAAMVAEGSHIAGIWHIASNFLQGFIVARLVSALRNSLGGGGMAYKVGGWEIKSLNWGRATQRELGR